MQRLFVLFFGWNVEQRRCRVNSVFNLAALFALKYEGWNFNSGNYLFTTDTK